MMDFINQFLHGSELPTSDLLPQILIPVSSVRPGLEPLTAKLKPFSIVYKDIMQPSLSCMGPVSGLVDMQVLL